MCLLIAFAHNDGTCLTDRQATIFHSFLVTFGEPACRQANSQKTARLCKYTYMGVSYEVLGLL